MIQSKTVDVKDEVWTVTARAPALQRAEESLSHLRTKEMNRGETMAKSEEMSKGESQ